MSDGQRASFLRRWFRDESLRRVYKNAGVLLRGRALAGLLGLGYLALAANTLGPAHYGVLIILNTYSLTIGELVVLPGWHSVIRYGNACLSEGRLGDLQRLFAFGMLTELGSGVLSVGVAAALLPAIGPLLGVPAETMPMALIYCVSALSIARSTAAGILYLFERFNTLALQQAGASIVRLVGACLAFLTDAGLTGFLVAWIVANLAEAASQWFFALKELHARGLLRGALVWPGKVTRAHVGLWRFSLATKVDRTTSLVSTRIPPLSVGFMLDPAAVGLYHVALRLGMQLAQPAMALSRSVYPELTSLAARQDLRSVYRVAVRTGLVATAIGLPLFLLYVAFGKPILGAIGGEGFDAAYTVLLMIAGGRVIHLLGFPLGAALTAMGLPGVAVRVNLAATVLLLPVLLALLHFVGLEGAGLHAMAFALATTIGQGTGLWLSRGERQTPAPPAGPGAAGQP